MLTPGDVLDDRYRLDERVAAGGMGEVWRATDTALRRGVAVKMLHADRADDPQFQVRFRREAHTMAALNHPGVAHVYDYGELDDGSGAYLVMAYVDGQPLDERIAQVGRLQPAETMRIVAQAAHALHAAHMAGIIHRDVKPGNLIVRPDGTVVLVDFGIARSAQSTSLTGVDEVVGTVLYIAPEQVSKQTTAPASDIYALGAVAYHCLAGRPPFLGDNPVTVAMQHLSDDPPPLPADVPAPVRDLVATAMAKDPAARFPSAAAMAAAAEAMTGAAGARAPAADRPATIAVATGAGTPPPSRRRSAIGWAAAGWAALLFTLAALGVILILANPAGLTPGPLNPPASLEPVPGSADPSQREPTGSTAGPSGSPRQPTGTATRPGAGGAASSPPGPSRSPTLPASPTAQPTPAPTTSPPPTTTNQQQEENALPPGFPGWR